MFYYGNIDLIDIVDQLRPHLQPTDIEVAAATFTTAVKRAPGGPTPLGLEEFHGMLSSSLTTLTAADDPRPMKYIASLAERFPSETELLATYLRSMAAIQPVQVSEQIDLALTVGYTTGWQQAWFLGALRAIAERASGTKIESGLALALTLAQDEETPWLARAEAAKLLGSAHRLSHELLDRLWARCPRAVQSDLATAVVSQLADVPPADRSAWAEAFIDSLSEDALLTVVVHRNR